MRRPGWFCSARRQHRPGAGRRGWNTGSTPLPPAHGSCAIQPKTPDSPVRPTPITADHFERCHLTLLVIHRCADRLCSVLPRAIPGHGRSDRAARPARCYSRDHLPPVRRLSRCLIIFTLGQGGPGRLPRAVARSGTRIDGQPGIRGARGFRCPVAVAGIEAQRRSRGYCWAGRDRERAARESAVSSGGCTMASAPSRARRAGR